MITLITGGPGLGKTALAVDLLMGEYAGRPIFSNIRGLLLEHSPLPLLADWTVEIANDQGTFESQFTFPPGSVVVIDECQQFFRPRATGSKVPPYVQAFETHRHMGIDFVLVTQGSRLLDINVRTLVKGGRHIFLKSHYLGRSRYEKSEIIDEEDRASLALAAKRKYSLPKKAFAWYKSSELHTKRVRPKLPLQAYIFGFLILGAVGMGWYAYDSISGKVGPLPGSAAQIVPGTGLEVAYVVPGTALVNPDLRLLDSLVLSDVDNPHSAPLYAAVRPQPVAPVVIGCVAGRSGCHCYTQQATRVWVPEPQCLERVAGTYYDPFFSPAEQHFKKPAPQDARPPAATGLNENLASLEIEPSK